MIELEELEVKNMEYADDVVAKVINAFIRAIAEWSKILIERVLE